RWLSTRSCRSTPACTSISAIRRARGSAAPTRTPAGCFDSTSRKAQTSPATAPKIWPQSQPRSTVGRARPSAGAPPPRASTSTWAPRHEPPQQNTHAAIAAPARPPGGPPQRQPRQPLQSHPNYTLLRGPVESAQYTSFDYTQVLADHDVLASIGSVGDAYDNAMAESFVDSFKTELIADRVWRTRSQLELAIVAYVAWFNDSRLHENLGDRPPREIEELYAVKSRTPTPTS